jgi:hypothetical protein
MLSRTGRGCRSGVEDLFQRFIKITGISCHSIKIYCPDIAVHNKRFRPAGNGWKIR